MIFGKPRKYTHYGLYLFEPYNAINVKFVKWKPKAKEKFMKSNQLELWIYFKIRGR
jgi:hypothetical protein